jgi:hypothetical protein
MHTLEFTLQQHTPIIHFQHDQEGATLRGSEVKPKLDFFIMQKLVRQLNPAVPDHEIRNQFKNCATDGSKPEWKVWLVGKGTSDHIALDYRIRVLDLDGRPLHMRSYGNIKLITDIIADKKAISSSMIQCRINCFDSRLLSVLSELIPDFFLLHNFGTRQNKAWGCYYHESHNSWDVVKSALLASGLPVYVSSQVVDKATREQNANNFYPTVSSKWKEMKSGINRYNRNGVQVKYKKSALFQYLCSKAIRWDKRWIKKHLLDLISVGELPANLLGSTAPNDCSSSVSNSWDDDTALNYTYRFGRAMLGLPEHFEFRADGGYIYQVVVKNDQGIERFKAPVTFKIYGNRLFAIASQPTAILNKEFHFEIQKKSTPQSGGPPVAEGNPIALREGENSATLSTPRSAKEFDIVDFLDLYFPNVGFNRLTASNINAI